MGDAARNRGRGGLLRRYGPAEARRAVASMSATSARASFRLRATGASVVAQVRTAWWRLLGMEIGAGTLLSKVHVTWPHQVSLGADCHLEHDIYFKFDGTWAPGR